MASKTLNFLLFGLIIIPSLAFASSTYTDQDIVNKYHVLNDLVIALDNGEISTNDLPDDMQTLQQQQAIYGNLTPNNQPVIVQTHQTKDSGFGISIYFYTLPFLGLIFPAIIYLRKHFHIKATRKNTTRQDEYEEVEWNNDKDGATMPKGFTYKRKVEKIEHPTIAKILLSLGIIKVKKK